MRITTSVADGVVNNMALQKRAGILKNDIWSQCTPALRKKVLRRMKKLGR